MTARFLLALALALPLSACSEPASEASSQDKAASRAAEPAPATETVVIDGESFTLELAATPVLRNRGLMYRTHVPPDGGMLFVFPNAFVQSFWMTNCLVDIDIIFLDLDGRVTAYHHMVAEEPRRPNETDEEYRERMTHYTSRVPAQFVIELAGGTLERLTIAEGDVIELDTTRLRALAE